MTRVTAFSSPLLLGFDEIERLLDRVSKSADGYPPYNIERIANGEEPARLRLTLAVAGFDPNEIEVTVEENELSVAGRQIDDASRDYLHRGIAARQFQRSFLLADGVEVKDALLRHGMLVISVVRPKADKIARRIDIRSA